MTTSSPITTSASISSATPTLMVPPQSNIPANQQVTIVRNSSQDSPSPPTNLAFAPPHQIIINSPSPESSPRCGRQSKRPSPLSPESMRNCLNISSGQGGAPSIDPHKLSPMSPAYPTSDLGSSPRSSISISNSQNWISYRDQKQRGSSSDFTDTDSEIAKDLLSPGLMLSPAPFSPFSECHGHSEGSGSGTGGSMTPAGGSSTCCLSPRSLEHSREGSLSGGSTGTTPRSFHFNFDPSSPCFHQHSNRKCFLLPPNDDGSRERSSSDSEAINASRLHKRVTSTLSSSTEPSPEPSDNVSSAVDYNFKATGGRGRGRFRHPRAVKKRFLDRFFQDQSSSLDEDRSGSACGSLSTGMQVQLRIAAPLDGEEFAREVQHRHKSIPTPHGYRPVDSQIVAGNSSHSPSPDMSLSPPTGYLSSGYPYPVSTSMGIPTSMPLIRLSNSSMEIGGISRRHDNLSPRTESGSGTLHPLSSSVDPNSMRIRPHVALQKSNSTTPVITPNNSMPCVGQSFLSSLNFLPPQTVSGGNTIPISSDSKGVIPGPCQPVGDNEDHLQNHSTMDGDATNSPVFSNQSYFDWWLRHQMAMASTLWPHKQQPPINSAQNPLFSTPFSHSAAFGGSDGLVPVDDKSLLHHSPRTVLSGGVSLPLSAAPLTSCDSGSMFEASLIQRAHILGPSRHFGIPYPLLNPKRSRSESDIAYVCSFCGQSFALHDRLAKHIASRHRDRSTSSTESPLKTHKCAVCGKAFGRSDMLTRHMRLHTGVKPYSCRICGQVFSRSDHLSTHQRTHTGEKPYGCPQCSYAASRRDMITRHMRTHLKAAVAAATAQLSSQSSEEAGHNIYDNIPITNNLSGDTVGQDSQFQRSPPAPTRPIFHKTGGSPSTDISAPRQSTSQINPHNPLLASSSFSTPSAFNIVTKQSSLDLEKLRSRGGLLGGLGGLAKKEPNTGGNSSNLLNVPFTVAGVQQQIKLPSSTCDNSTGMNMPKLEVMDDSNMDQQSSRALLASATPETTDQLSPSSGNKFVRTTSIGWASANSSEVHNFASSPISGGIVESKNFTKSKQPEDVDMKPMLNHSSPSDFIKSPRIDTANVGSHLIARQPLPGSTLDVDHQQPLQNYAEVKMETNDADYNDDPINDSNNRDSKMVIEPSGSAVICRPQHSSDSVKVVASTGALSGLPVGATTGFQVPSSQGHQTTRLVSSLASVGHDPNKSAFTYNSSSK